MEKRGEEFFFSSRERLRFFVVAVSLSLPFVALRERRKKPALVFPSLFSLSLSLSSLSLSPAETATRGGDEHGAGAGGGGAGRRRKRRSSRKASLSLFTQEKNDNEQ